MEEEKTVSLFFVFELHETKKRFIETEHLHRHEKRKREWKIRQDERKESV